jgi:RNA polymerase-binding protein DksA
LTEQQLGELRTRLEERARALVAQLHELAQDLPSAPNLTQTTVEDDAEHGEERTRAALRGAEQDRDAAELREITMAMARIDEGRYGICVDCGNDIPLARLTVQPAATRCVSCQRRYEARHPNEVRAVLGG